MRYGLLLSLCLILTACQPVAPVTDPSTALPSPQASPTPVGLPVPTATTTPEPTSPPPANEITHYQISASLDESLRSLHGIEAIRFTNPTSAALEVLPLAVEANRYPDAFELIAVTAEGTNLTVESLDSNQLWLRLEPALPAGAALTLQLEYRLQLPPIQAEKPQVFGYTQRQINLADWYPSLPPYSALDGWLIHPPGEVGEHTVYPVADFDIELQVPQRSPQLVVAASAPAETIPGGYRYHLKSARNFVWSASQEYRVSTLQAGGVTVLSYAYPATELAARAALDYAVQAVNYFTKIFAVAPRGSLSIVQADFPDGMEYDGLFFLSERFYYGFDGSPRSYLALIAVHETAHQWWYARVGSDQALEPWLDEALCTYSELLFYENVNPELADWWWGFRVEPYVPQGSLTATIYDFSQFTPYRNQIYLRGAQFLDSLRQTTGDAAFYSGLRAYLQRFEGEIATRQGFLDAFQPTAGVDLSPVIAEYFSP